MGTKKNLKNLLKELQDVMGVTGCEQEVVKYVYDHIKPYADSVEVSTTGNIVAVKKGHKEGPSIMVAAHTDEVGFTVRNIMPNGYILFDKQGTAPDNILLARAVLVSTQRIPGVIGTKPGHLQSPAEASSVKKASELYIDIGVSSAEEAKKLGIRLGDPIIFRTEFIEMANPDIVTARAVDNKLGCALVIELFKNLKAEDFAGTLYGVFTVREETGLWGARNAVYGLDIDYCIAIDTVPAGDTPDINTESQLPIHLGNGPALIISDGMGATFYQFVHPGVRRMIEAKAAAKDINLQVTTILGYAYTTDAAAFSYVGKGLPTAILSIPRRYSHSPVEVTNLNDAVGAYDIVEGLVRDNENADLDFVKL